MLANCLANTLHPPFPPLLPAPQPLPQRLRRGWALALAKSPSPLGLLIFAPLASRHHSVLLGFVACAFLFSALGFVVVPFSMGWAVG